jgi:ABC-type bacteriocin/lantibiotic exporter with double-glycine peptidase domain
MVERFERGLDTPIGEALAFLSGGQRQRLAFAHALYRARDLLILDEATGQLDAASEATVIDALRDLPKELTLIVVSHREAPFACCEVVYKLSGGKLARAV